MELTYEVVLEPSDEGGFTVFVPALRGCVSEGATEEEALENIKTPFRVGSIRGNRLRTSKLLKSEEHLRGIFAKMFH